MSTAETLAKVNDLLSARRVFSEPVERDGVVVIPAAVVGGGGGTERVEGDKEGGGMGLRARPVGAFELRNGNVAWKAAIDWNRVILRAQLVVLAMYLARTWTQNRHRD